MHCVWKHVQLPRYIAKIQAVIDGRCQGTMSMKIMLLSPRLLPNRFRSCFWREFNNTTRSIKLVKQTHKRGIKNFVLSPHWVWQVFRWQLHQMANGESTCWWCGGRILGAMPFAANLAGVRAQLRANRTKNEKNQAEFASRPRDTKKSLSSPDSPQFFIHKVHFQSHHLTARSHSLMPNTGGVIGLGVCCIFLEGGRANAAVKPRYFLPHPSYVCRQETKPPKQCVFQKKRWTLFIFTWKLFKWDEKRALHIPIYLLLILLLSLFRTVRSSLVFMFPCTTNISCYKLF